MVNRANSKKVVQAISYSQPYVKAASGKPFAVHLNLAAECRLLATSQLGRQLRCVKHFHGVQHRDFVEHVCDQMVGVVIDPCVDDPQ
jgi:hypothetical protein